MDRIPSQRCYSFLLLIGSVLMLAGCGSNHIWQSAEFGQHQELERMLNNDPKLLNAQDKAGWTPLMHAIAGRHDQSVKLLLDRGADPTIKAGSNWDALHEARKQNKQSILKMVEAAIEEADKKGSDAKP